MKYVRKRKTDTAHQQIYMESRKMALMNLFVGKEQRPSVGNGLVDKGGEGVEGDELRGQHQHKYTPMCEIDS